PASPFRSGRAAAKAEAAPERPPEKCIPAPRSREKAPPPPAPQEEPSGEAGAAPPAPAAQTPRPEPVLAEPGPRAEKRLTLEPRAPSSGEGGGVVPRGVPPQPSPEEAGGVVPRGLPPHLTRRGSGPPSSLPLSLDEAPAELGAVTFPWKFRSDYVFGFLEGKHKGSKISLLASELSDDRIITLGSPGERLNDIEVEDPRVANDQAFLRFRGGRFTLVNQRADNVVFVNNLALKEGDQVVLMTGDRLEIGDTVLVFMERRVVDILQCYDLEVLNGVGNDVGRTFELTKERMLVGRGRNCDVRLSDLEISRVHAVLVHRDGRFYVQHRSETNPTFVNGISLLPGAERMITPDDRIQLSSHTVLRFRQRKP
ncbi:MAG TPA: FHA domain-containing protein, partial [Candidatus Nitrosotenuis sp.]|nr:FHA domain-containing protein [Candidatus Nitrosotenuis sp.]